MMLRALQWERRAAARARLREMGERALRPLALAGAMFLTMRAEILPGMPPLALALMAAGLAAGERAGALVAGVLLGMPRLPLRDISIVAAAGCALLLGMELAAPYIPPLRRMSRDARASAFAGFAALLPGLARAGGDWLASAQALACAAFAASAAPFLLSALGLRRGRRRLTGAERLGLALLAGGALAGLCALWRPLAEGAAALLALCMPLPGAAALGGIALFAGGAGMLKTASLALCALAAGAKLCAARWQRALAFAAVAALSWLLGGAGALSPGAALCAGAVYLLIPEATLARALRPFSRADDATDAERAVAAALADAKRRLTALGAAFGDLAEGCASPASVPDEQALICEMRARLCADCPGYAACWAGADNRGVRLLCRLIGDALERVDAPPGMRVIYSDGEIPPEILRACRRGKLTPDRLGLLLRDFAERRRSEIKRCATGRMMSVQFAQARRILLDLAERQGAPALNAAQLERLRAALEAEGLGDCALFVRNSEMLELEIARPAAPWTREELRRAGGVLARSLGGRFAPDVRGERLVFARRPRFRAETGACCQSGVAGQSCGDSHLVRVLNGSHLVLMISDGMGMGEAAAAESAETLRLLWRFLEAGVSRALALEAVNQQMLMRSGEDIFATVDLCIVDMNTGEAEFTKLAACRTLILRGGAAAQIEGGRLPLGILERVRPEVCRVRLRPGDVLVMGSDGVMEFGTDAELERVACAGADRPAEQLSEALVRAASLKRAAERIDDMTCVCARMLDARRAG